MLSCIFLMLEPNAVTPGNKTDHEGTTGAEDIVAVIASKKSGMKFLR